MKVSPLAVVIGPPMFGTPTGAKIHTGNGARSRVVPSGTSQRFSPVLTSIAASVPHGGGLQGAPSGDVRKCRWSA